MHGSGLGFYWAMNSVAFCLFWVVLLIPSLGAVEPVVLQVQAERLPGTRWVDIAYEVHDPDSALISVYLKVSADGGATWDVPATSVQGAVGRGIKAGEIQHIRWDSSVDHPHRYSKNLRFKVGVTDWVPPVGMSLIQEGGFEMAGPPHTVMVSEFAMDVHEVTRELWESVRQWSLDHGYLDLPLGQSFGAEHPVHTVNWFDCVKWCNARSEMEGMRPAYYLDAASTVVYRSGRIAPHVDWYAGYRLPTEAEWEKAARGGATGHRFPWADSEKITPDRANYDESEKNGSVRVGSYAPNGFGLYDMAGNHFEWCWDRFGDYTSEPQTDPRGPTVGVHRVFRGGGWYDNAKNCEISNRRAFTPDTVYNRVGFRSVLPRPARPWVESQTQDVTLDSHPRWMVNGIESDISVTAGEHAKVRLSNRFERGQIFYSIDGSQPTVQSRKYTGEFIVDQSMVLRELHLSEELTETLELAPVRLHIVLTPALKRYPHGSRVRVLAVPDPGYGLSLWGGDGVGQTGGEWTLTVTNASPKVSALFGPVLKPCP